MAATRPQHGHRVRDESMQKYKPFLRTLTQILSARHFPRLYTLAMRGVDAKNLGA